MISRRFSDLAVGDEFGDSITVSSWHLATAAAMYYDPNPAHVNLAYCAKNRFGRPIAPGFLTVGLMMGVVSRYFGWSIEALLQTSVDFVSPVFADDTVEVRWRISALESKPAKFDKGGIVHLHGTCLRLDGGVAAELIAAVGVSDTERQGWRELVEGHGEHAGGVRASAKQ